MPFDTPSILLSGLKNLKKIESGGGEEIAEWDPSAPLTPAFHPILVQTANTHDEIIFMQSFPLSSLSSHRLIPPLPILPMIQVHCSLPLKS